MVTSISSSKLKFPNDSLSNTSSRFQILIYEVPEQILCDYSFQIGIGIS